MISLQSFSTVGGAARAVALALASPRLSPEERLVIVLAVARFVRWEDAGRGRDRPIFQIEVAVGALPAGSHVTIATLDAALFGAASSPARDFETRWAMCFDAFAKQAQTTRILIRRAISRALVRHGASEVGSSDISHGIFERWESNGHDFGKVVGALVDEERA